MVSVMRRADKFTHIVPGLVLAAGLLLPSAQWDGAHAAGLGKINVLSRYGQPFFAEIDLINVSRDELATLNASLAPTSAYNANNLRFDSSLNSLRLSVERRDNGTLYVRATTTRRVNEPYVDLLIDLTWQGGKFQRHYSALLDLPSGSDATAASVAAAATATPTSPLLPSPPQAAATVSVQPQPVGQASAPAPSGALPPLRTIPARKPQVQEAAPSATPPPVAAKGRQAMGAPASPQAPVKAGDTATTGAKPETAPTAPPKAEPSKPADTGAAATAGAAGTNTSAAPASPATAEPSTIESRAEPKAEAKPEPEAEPVTSAPPPPPATKPVAPPPAQPGWAEQLLDDWWLVLGVLFALGVPLAGFLFLRRRAARPNDQPEPTAVGADVGALWEAAPALSSNPPGMAMAPGDTDPPAPDAAPAKITVANSSDVVDPLDEAKVYVAHGQYEEAEKVLREALSKQRGREDVQVTLLQILAEQGNKEGFNKIAGDMHKRTGGRGDGWKRVAAMGYALDPAHPLYPPTAEAVEAAELGRLAGSAAIQAENEIVEFDLTAPEGQVQALAGTQDNPMQSVAERVGLDEVKTMQLWRVGLSTAPLATDRPAAEFIVEFPKERPEAEAAAAGTVAEPVAAKEDAGLDFKTDLPSFDATLKPVSEPAKDANAPLDFSVEVLDAAPPAVEVPVTPELPQLSELPVINVASDPLLDAGEAHPKDEHWHDVQQKFDLMRAYQEMGDQDGVREVLGEIISEGDVGQQAEARKLLAQLK